MGSFTEAMTYLAGVLSADSALLSFSRTKWGRAPLIKQYFKFRTEIGLSDLPVILMTRPSVEKNYRLGVRDAVHTVRLYCGFHQPDRDLAQQEMIGLEEAIDDALSELGEAAGILTVKPDASENDEGKYHPVYFFVMDVEVQHRRMRS